MGARRNNQGPLRHSELLQIGSTDGVVFWDRTLPPKVKPESIDADYIIEMGDRHDLLATRQLGSAHMGWAIMERNNDIVPEEVDMRLWPNDFVPGLTIKIPALGSLRRRGIV